MTTTVIIVIETVITIVVVIVVLMIITTIMAKPPHRVCQTSPSRIIQCLYEEFTRLAETRQAQNTLNK